MKYLFTTSLTGKILFSFITSGVLLVFQGLNVSQNRLFVPPPVSLENAPVADSPAGFAALQASLGVAAPAQADSASEASLVDFVQQPSGYPFANPAGCSLQEPGYRSAESMLRHVQSVIGDDYNLAERRQTYIWNGDQGLMLDVTQDPFVFEFAFNEFQHPLTYRGDRLATIFLIRGLSSGSGVMGTIFDCWQFR